MTTLKWILSGRFEAPFHPSQNHPALDSEDLKNYSKEKWLSVNF